MEFNSDNTSLDTKNETTIHRKSYSILVSLTIAGALPFLLLTALLHTNWLPKAMILEFTICYAAVILTFLGGIQWGIGLMKLEDKTLLFPHIFTVSILPPLVTWLLLLLDDPKLQLIGFILGFTVVLIVDAGFTLKKIIAPWFFTLRLAITLIVITLLISCYYSI